MVVVVVIDVMHILMMVRSEMRSTLTTMMMMMIMMMVVVMTTDIERMEPLRDILRAATDDARVKSKESDKLLTDLYNTLPTHLAPQPRHYGPTEKREAGGGGGGGGSGHPQVIDMTGDDEPPPLSNKVFRPITPGATE